MTQTPLLLLICCDKSSTRANQWKQISLILENVKTCILASNLQIIRQWPLGDRDSMEFSESRDKHQIDKIKSKEISFLTTMCIRQKTISIQSVCKNFSQSRGYCQGVQREPTHFSHSTILKCTRTYLRCLALFYTFDTFCSIVFVSHQYSNAWTLDSFETYYFLLLVLVDTFTFLWL